MIDEQTQELVLQYLLGELDPSQMETVRTRIEADTELKNFALKVEETVGSIAYAVQPIAAPPDIHERILRVERRPVLPAPEAPRSRRAALSFIPWALAASLAIACIILGLDRERVRNRLSKELAALQETLLALKQNAAEEEQRLEELRRRDADSQKQLTELKEKDRLAQIKIATLSAQVAAFRQTNAIVVWDPDQRRGVLQLDKLPPPAPGKDYQLWVIDSKKPQPVSAGVLSVPNNGLIRTSFQPTAPVESAAAFAISVEKRGGSMKPEGQIILVGK
jgi:anti-sigma-K factor RskA